jgi:hypothetical protein
VTQDAVLYSREGMLDDGSSKSHRSCGRPLIHPRKSLFEHVPRDSPRGGCGAALLQRTRAAVLRIGQVDDRFVFLEPCLTFQRFLVRTEVRVRFGSIAEGVALEEGAIAMWVSGPRSGNARLDAITFALGCLLSIRVARVCNDMEVSFPSTAFAAAAIGFRLRLSAASSTTSWATISACSASTELCKLYAGCVWRPTTMKPTSGSG